MNEEVKLCELCGMHRKLNINPAGAVWLEKDGAGDALLVVEPVVGRTLPIAVPVWFCPACGRDFRPRKEEKQTEGDTQYPKLPFVDSVFVTPYAKDKIREAAKKNGITECDMLGQILEAYFEGDKKDEANT